MAKASIKALDTLHDAVATQLSANLDDPKILATAIRFLKDNNITVDLQESQETQNLFTTIQNIKVRPEDAKRDKVEVLLEQYM